MSVERGTYLERGMYLIQCMGIPRLGYGGELGKSLVKPKKNRVITQPPRMFRLSNQRQHFEDEIFYH